MVLPIYTTATTTMMNVRIKANMGRYLLWKENISVSSATITSEKNKATSMPRIKAASEAMPTTNPLR